MRFVFPNEGRAQAALDQMNRLIEWYGVASRADMMDIHGTTPRPEDQKFGWNDLSNATISPDDLEGAVILTLPRALRLE